MTTRLLAAAAAVALLLTLIINGPFGINEGTYRKIYSALAPKTAPARDAQQQSENKLPNPEGQVACLIGQAAVSIHGQFGSGHDTEKAAEIAIKQAMRVCPHSLESSDFGFVIAAVEAIAGAIGLEEPADDRDLRFPWFFQGSWCRVEEDERGISLEPARPDHQCSARLTVAATEIGGEIPTVTGEKFLSCSLIEATPNKQGLYFTQLTCADNPWRTGIFLSEGRLLVGKLSAR
jgi:hypothetical protein